MGMSRRLYQHALTRTLLEGFEVLAARHEAAALAAIGRRLEDRPDVILLDARTPVTGGAEFARRYRQTPGPHAAVLLLTAADDPAGRAAALQADGVLAKPFDLRALVEFVARSVRTPAASAQGAGRSGVAPCGGMRAARG